MGIHYVWGFDRFVPEEAVNTTAESTKEGSGVLHKKNEFYIKNVAHCVRPCLSQPCLDFPFPVPSVKGFFSILEATLWLVLLPPQAPLPPPCLPSWTNKNTCMNETWRRFRIFFDFSRLAAFLAWENWQTTGFWFLNLNLKVITTICLWLPLLISSWGFRQGSIVIVLLSPLVLGAHHLHPRVYYIIALCVLDLEDMATKEGKTIHGMLVRGSPPPVPKRLLNYNFVYLGSAKYGDQRREKYSWDVGAGWVP